MFFRGKTHQRGLHIYPGSLFAKVCTLYLSFLFGTCNSLHTKGGFLQILGVVS